MKARELKQELKKVTSPNNSDVIVWAKTYKKAGFNPIPCLPNQKVPAVEWKDFQNQDIPLETIIPQFEHNTNIGITQTIVKYAIIDFDNINEMIEHLKEYIDFDKKTLIANTSKGFHVLALVRNYDVINERLKSQKQDDLKVIPFRSRNGNNAGEIRLKGNTLVPPSTVSAVKRNWYYLTINEAIELRKQDQFESVKELTPEDFLNYIEFSELLEIDLLCFKDLIAPKIQPITVKQFTLDTPIESFNELQNKLIEILIKHWKPSQRHSLALALASFLKYKLLQLNLSFEDAKNFTLGLIKAICELTNDEEFKDRERAVIDTFEEVITEHNLTLAQILREDFEKLKALFKAYRTRKLDIVENILQNIVGYVYDSSNTIKVVFSNSDFVELSASKLFNYVQLEYAVFFDDTEEETEFKKNLLQKVKKHIAKKRIHEIKILREGIHKVSKNEFVLVFSNDEIYVYNTDYDDLTKIHKFYSEHSIRAKRELLDFDSTLFYELMQKDKNILLEEMKNIFINLKEYIKHWNFEKEFYNALASLVIALPTHTTWQWRPIVHFVGTAGVGKTTFFEYVFATIYKSLFRKINSSSVAGLLQQFSNTSYIVAYDNFETTQSQKTQFFTLLESSSTGAEEIKGTVNGESIVYKFNNIVFLNSVIDFAEKEAIDSRLVQFRMFKANNKPSRIPEYEARRIATYSLVFTLRFAREIEAIHEQLSRLGREYQNIACMYAIDKLLFDANLDDYKVFLERERVTKEEIAFLKQIFLTNVQTDFDNKDAISMILEYVRLVKQKTYLEHKDFITTKATFEKKLSQLATLYGIKLIENKNYDFEVAIFYDKLVHSRKFFTNQITEKTFNNYCKTLRFTSKVVSIDNYKTRAQVISLDTLCELLSIEI